VSPLSDVSATNPTDPVLLQQQTEPSSYRRNPPIFDIADLWIIPENYGGIGYPQYLENTGYQTYEGMEMEQGSTMDGSTYAVNGMDLLEM
jgi:hypothetical protein